MPEPPKGQSVSLKRSLFLCTLGSTLVMVAFGVMYALGQPGHTWLRLMLLQVGVGITMGVLLGFGFYLLSRWQKSRPARKPKGTANRSMLTAGISWGLLAMALQVYIGAQWQVAIVIAFAFAILFGALSRVGFKRAEREYLAQREGGGK